jgi:2'-5' RNA ligase
MADLNLPDFLALVNYPKISKTDFLWINNYRKQHDDFYDLIGAHFTFVFPVFDIEKDRFMNEVKKQAKGFKKIDFQIKCAVRNNDRTNDYWHVLLVPDKGFSDMVKLHGKLYSGLFRPIERLDLDFTPHVGIANSKDPKACKRMVEEVNAMNIDIRGRIDQLEIVQYRDKQISTVEIVKLL